MSNSMDSQSKSPDKADAKPSFRKPSNDAVNRKYRRHSPSGSASSSSGGSPLRGRNRSPINSWEDTSKTSDDRRRKKDERRDLDRDAGVSRHGKDGDSCRDYNRQYHGSRHDDHNRHHKYSTEGNRDYQRLSSRSGRETSRSSRSDHMRYESEYDRSRDCRPHVDKYSRDRLEDVGRSNKDKGREHTDLEHQKYRSKESSSDRAASGRRHTSSNIEERSGDRDRHGRDRGGWDDYKDHKRSSRDHKNDHVSSYEESGGYEKDSSIGRDSGGGGRVKEILNPKELDGQKDFATKKRKFDDREPEKHKEQYDREEEEHLENDYRHSSGYRKRDGRHEQVKDKTSGQILDQDSSLNMQKLSDSVTKSITSELDEGPPPSSSKQVLETSDKVNEERSHSSAGEVEATTDLNAAKVAAMKAAELVNRNLIGSGYMSADQKKKLLWGNKKNTASEESGHRWGLPLFSDRERQEKFNKLMGVKGDAKQEQKPEEKDGSGILQSEKQKELELDLEKHYTAGLRRRDGRTVGLGL